MIYATRDRVILNPKDAASYLLPYRQFAQEGRVGTIEGITRQYSPVQYRVEFDTKRKGAKPHVGWYEAKDLLPA